MVHSQTRMNDEAECFLGRVGPKQTKNKMCDTISH